MFSNYNWPVQGNILLIGWMLKTISWVLQQCCRLSPYLTWILVFEVLANFVLSFLATTFYWPELSCYKLYFAKYLILSYLLQPFFKCFFCRKLHSVYPMIHIKVFIFISHKKFFRFNNSMGTIIISYITEVDLCPYEANTKLPKWLWHEICAVVFKLVKMILFSFIN